VRFYVARRISTRLGNIEDQLTKTVAVLDEMAHVIAELTERLTGGSESR